MAKNDITRALAALAGGEPGGVDRVLPLVYEEFRSLAEGLFRREGAGQTLQPTALVHEA